MPSPRQEKTPEHRVVETARVFLHCSEEVERSGEYGPMSEYEDAWHDLQDARDALPATPQDPERVSYDVTGLPSGPTTVMVERPDEEPEWPVVWLADVVGAKRRGFTERRDRLQLCVADPGPGDLPIETYYPASAPNVLSPEEAQEIATYLEGSGREEIQRLWFRLKGYATEGDTQ